MAEAVRPAQQQKSSKNKTASSQSHVDDDSPSTTEISDAALAARLKSLTSFINNIEPSDEKNAAQEETTTSQKEASAPEPLSASAPPPLSHEAENEQPQSSQYYTMITEKAAQEQALGFKKLINDINQIKVDSKVAPTAPKMSISNIEPTAVKAPTTIDYNMERIKHNIKLAYPRLNWNKVGQMSGQQQQQQQQSDELIDWELNRFYEQDLNCKELEVYYKCKYMQAQLVERTSVEFIERHSILDDFKYKFLNGVEQRQNAEFYELVRDYYEARRLVGKCQKHIGEFKQRVVVANMKKIWSFEKYTIESFGVCGDQQRCKHELTSEKAYLNKTELSKLQMNLYEMRFNLVKNGLISSLFCSKLAKFKIESYLNEFMQKFRSRTNDAQLNSSDLQCILDILFYFYRKHNRIGVHLPGVSSDAMTATTTATSNMMSSYYDPDDDSSSAANGQENNNEDFIDSSNDDDDHEMGDRLLKLDLVAWIKSLAALLVNHTETYRMTTSTANFATASSLHFDNVYFILEHLLRSPDCGQFAHLVQFPIVSIGNLVAKHKIDLHSSKSDPLVNLYFDGYLRLVVPFARYIKQRDAFLFLSKSRIDNFKRHMNKQADKCWQFIDLEGEPENLESLLIEISEDDLMQLYYQIPFNSLFKFLWGYYQAQQPQSMKQAGTEAATSMMNPAGADEFRKRYVSMKIISFLDCLVRSSLRSLLLYNKLKYKNFCKLVGKTLREIIKFLSTLLLATKDAIRDNYENFLKRIISTIVYSARLRPIRWTLLSQLNIGKLDLNTKWLLLAIMCGIDVYHSEFEAVFRSKLENSVSEYVLQSCQNDLEAILNENPSNGEDLTGTASTTTTNANTDVEWLSFMRTVHFLIDLETSESPNTVDISDRMFDFMSCVVKVIFKVAYCYQSTKDVCHKEGNSLLSAICSNYPSLIGVILNEIDVELLQVGKQALFLCDQLPFSKWLPYINTRSDMTFIEKCLLSQPTNSVLFRLATNLIDRLDFDEDVEARSRLYIDSSPSPTLADSIQTFGFVDSKFIVKLRLSIILFELHSRLSIYNYFSRGAAQFEEIVDTSGNDGSQNRARRDDLVTHYAQLAKDKRIALIYWIWQQFYRMRLFYQIISLRQVDYLEEVSRIYAREANRRTDAGGVQSCGFMKFYQIYLSKRPDEVVEISSTPASTDASSNNASVPTPMPSIITVLQPKCPLECYLRLIFTYSGHDLNYLFDHSLALINVILSANKKDAKLQTLTYLLLFDWFEAILYRYCVIDVDKETVNELIDELRTAKRANAHRLSQLLLVLFNPSPQSKLIDHYCAKLQKSLRVLAAAIKSSKEDLKRRRVAEENFQNYLYLWLELLITSVRNWHKYKCIVKIIDFLVAYSFKTEMSDKFMNLNLLNELFNYVKSDFGVLNANEPSTEQAVVRSSSPENTAGNGSGWGIQPSFSWISSSVSYVVTTTTSTLGAAIGVGSSSSDYFDAAGPNQQQQFSYDKRLYKECPYIGFYLSLCEERIECQLGIWTTFLQTLINPPSDINPSSSASTFIESCWKRTLSTVNKSNNVNLSFPWHRLMLFKWCERALELPHDHPLLILYWQKFFNIYLDKEYISTMQSISRSSSAPTAVFQPNRRASNFDLEMTDESSSSQTTSNSSSIQQSPTFRLFTSTSQFNSLLKQLKKQLELTSQHYAYQLTPNNNGSAAQGTASSAPIASYHFNELMSKLYYALSLWVDETRLHDPNLYLPALPSHYEPNLLAKVFSRQCDFWTEYIDLRFVNEHLNSIISAGCLDNKPSSANTSLKSSSASSHHHHHNQHHHDDLFFNQPDRMLNHLPTLNQINLAFRYPLKEKFGDAIDNVLNMAARGGGGGGGGGGDTNQIDLIVNVCEHLLKSIFKYNKEFINHSLNHMLKMDDKLTNKLLVHLWHNEVCEKYVQVGCTSIINPMHECTRPAMVKFVYEVATKRDQVKEEIRENRINHDKLMSNFMETDTNSYELMSKFPHDDIVVSMVAMTQLIKKLLKNYHVYQQQQKDDNKQPSNTNINNILLTRLFYLLIDMYETQMNHPNDVLNPAKSNSTSPMHLTGWSVLIQNEQNELVSLGDQQSSLGGQSPPQQINSDSIHLFMFDLINLMGGNFIQNNSIRTMKKSNQQLMLEKIIDKLTSSISLTSILERNGNTAVNLSTRRSGNMLLNSTRNKLSLMALCAQFVEPNDLELFNEFYMNILASISSILLNEINSNGSTTSSSNGRQAEGAAASENPEADSNLPKLDENEMINQKFGIILQLLTKFSFINLSRLLESNGDNSDSICTQFVDININFLTDLNLDCLNTTNNNEQSTTRQEQIAKRDHSLKQIIDQCIDNYVSILNISYPFYFDYILKRCLEFSSKPFSLKYGSRHLSRFITIFQQNELAGNLVSDASRFLTRSQFESTFKYIDEFFTFERTRFRSQKRSFYSHWSLFARQLAQLFSMLFINYFDKFMVKEMSSNLESMAQFEASFDGLFSRLTDLFRCWIEPSSVLEVTAATQINVKEVFEMEISSVGARDEMISTRMPPTNPSSAILLMIDSFFDTFNTILKRFSVFSTAAALLSQKNRTESQANQQSDCIILKNYALNRLIHFYYERIACELNASNSINDNTLDCYHRCMSKYASSWYGHGGFEPDYRTVQIMSELCAAQNTRLVKHLAYDLVCYFNLARIAESYLCAPAITPMQINDLLKAILQTLSEFCLRDAVRESSRFELVLRPVYNQAEVLQCWSMLSDAAYSSVVIERFCAAADYSYAFASRGTDRGLLMMLLKAAAEFYTLADRSSLSCFASAKRRCYLKAVCTLLLKPSIQTIRQESELFQHCVINLLTDIETFSISATSTGTPQQSSNIAEPIYPALGDTQSQLKHEIQLLIDECLVLVVGEAANNNAHKQICEQYRLMFEAWLSSSKDSPVLTHFVNRVSRSYKLLIASTNSEAYSNMLELCLDVFFETDRNEPVSRQQQQSVDLDSPSTKLSSGWSTIMDEIEFKLNSASSNNSSNSNESCDLFEFKLLAHSCYLTLNAYMIQRAALIKASANNEHQHVAYLLKYCENVLGTFFQAQTTMFSKPKPGKEEKFILVCNRLLEFFLTAMYVNRAFEHKIGELVIRLATLLNYYGEDSLSNQNPINDSQSLLSTIGLNLNILAKKSPYSTNFRFYTRCMSICLLKQIMIANEEEAATKKGALYPNLGDMTSSIIGTGKWIYKVRMSGADAQALGREAAAIQFDNSATNLLSTSLPNTSSSPLTSPMRSSSSEMHNSYAQLLKQSAYQFHLIFQTKTYSSSQQLLDLANHVNQHLQTPSANAQHFCLPQCLAMSRHLASNLFTDIFYF